MITKQNYMQQVKMGLIPFAQMPKDLADTHAEMKDYLEFYSMDADIKGVVDLYLQKVNAFIEKSKRPQVVIKPAPPQEKPAPIINDEPVINTLDEKKQIQTAGFSSTGKGKLLGAFIGMGLLFASASMFGDDDKKPVKRKV